LNFKLFFAAIDGVIAAMAGDLQLYSLVFL